VWYSVPSALISLLEQPKVGTDDLRSLRLVLFAGEVFPPKHLRRLRSVVPSAPLCNLYGPTETNVCTWFALDPSQEISDKGLPIGKPIAGVSCRVIDDAGRDVSSGETGELVVEGPTVMQGYLNADGATGVVGVYQTGDLVRVGSDGNLWFVGRRDAQVKTRGYRVELGEVELVIGQHPYVFRCGVVALPDDLIGNRLVAFVVTMQRAALDRQSLKVWCVERLPRYMIPDDFRFVASFPLTTTGKVDRQVLLAKAVAS
jgi:acyl-coenzyme A synthetase/AMP-(fatty) acid ligase